MDNNITAPDRRDLYLTAGMVLCGFFFLEGGMIDPEAALGKAVFIAATCAASVLYLHAEGIRQNRGSMWVLASIIVLSLPFVFFSGCTEHIITMLALIPMCFYWIACSCGQTMDSKLSVYAIGDVIKQGLVIPFRNYGSCPEIIAQSSKGPKSRSPFLVGAGILIAIPLMAAAAILLSQADKSFSTLIDTIAEQLSWKWARYLGETILGIPVAFYMFGLLYGNTKGEKREDFNKDSLSQTAQSLAKLPALIGTTVLICLNVIYAVFLGLQIRHVIIGLPEEMTYSEFARQGFFQLCEVAMINLAVITAVSIFRKKKDTSLKLMKIQISIMSVFTIGISCTALTKMFMYIDVYGLTQKRVYTSVFMVFLIIVFAAIAIHQFRRINLGRVICIAGILILILFNYAGVDRTIARYNIARYEKGTLEMMNMDLMVTLDDSALPDLYRVWKETEAFDMAELLRRNKPHYTWADWSIERARANKVREDYYRNFYCLEEDVK